MKTLLTFIATLFAFTAFAQGPVLRTPYTVNTADVVTNIVRNIGTNSTIHAGKLATGGTLPALNGSALTSLNGTAIASGTVADARLSANIPKKDAVNIFSASNYISAGMFGDLTVQNNIVGQGNISLNGLLGDPNFATVSLDTSTGDFLTAGSIYLTSGAEMIFGNGGGLSNLPSASLVGALPAIDGSQLTGISGSGITAAQLQPNLTNLISLVDGTKVARSNLVIFTMGDSRWLSERAIKILTNRPEFYGAKAHINVVTAGGGGVLYATNSWETNGLISYSNVVNRAAGDVPIMVDHCSINLGDGLLSNDTNGGAFYYAIKTNFYATRLIPLGFKVFAATVDVTSNNPDPSSGMTDEGMFIYNNLIRTRTNYTAGIIELQLRTPNSLDTDLYSDGVHPTYGGYAQWADALAHDLQFGANRVWVSEYRTHAGLVKRAYDGTLVFCLRDDLINTANLKVNISPITSQLANSSGTAAFQAHNTAAALALYSRPSYNVATDLLIAAYQDTGAGAQPVFYMGVDGGILITGGNGTIKTSPGALIAGNNAWDLHLISRTDGSFALTNATHGISLIDGFTNGPIHIPGTLTVDGGRITNNGIVWIVGAGDPEGVDVAGIGSIKSRTDGSTDTALYRKETGTGNTGWVAVSAGGGSFDPADDYALTGTNSFAGGTFFGGSVYFGPTTQIKDNALGDSIYPSSHRLIDGGVLSLDWTNRTLNNASGTTLLSWYDGLVFSGASTFEEIRTPLLISTNIVIRGLSSVTNSWAGPTNALPLHQTDHFYSTLVPLHLTNISDYYSTNRQYTTLEVTNASSSNVWVWNDAQWQSTDSTNYHTIPPGKKAKLFVDAAAYSGTNFTFILYGDATAIGEYVSAQLLTANAISLTTATTANVTNISITAGEWDVTGVVNFNLSGVTATDFRMGSHTTSATLGGQDTFLQKPFSFTGLSSTYADSIPVVRYNVSSTTTIYLVAQSTFSLGTATASGTLRARRVR